MNKQLDREAKIKKAHKAVERGQAVEYLLGVKGWNLIKDEIDKEIKWAFEKSVSPTFKEEVKDKSEVYFEHYGYVNGLRQIDAIIKKIMTAADTANEDIKKWESKKNPL